MDVSLWQGLKDSWHEFIQKQLASISFSLPGQWSRATGQEPVPGHFKIKTQKCSLTCSVWCKNKGQRAWKAWTLPAAIGRAEGVKSRFCSFCQIHQNCLRTPPPGCRLHDQHLATLEQLHRSRTKSWTTKNTQISRGTHTYTHIPTCIVIIVIGFKLKHTLDVCYYWQRAISNPFMGRARLSYNHCLHSICICIVSTCTCTWTQILDAAGLGTPALAQACRGLK